LTNKTVLLVVTKCSKDTQTHRQMQSDFIICPMLYAISYGTDKNGLIRGYTDARA